MPLLPLLFVFLYSLELMFAMQNSTLYRYPTGRVLFGKFKRDPFYYLWEEKLISSTVVDQSDCTFLCVGYPKCYSFNMAAFSVPKGIHLCELLATDNIPQLVFLEVQIKGSQFIILNFLCCYGLCYCFSGNRTCSDVKYCNPEAKSCSYVIDSDEEGGVKPFKVFCDMTDKGGVGVTVVSHESESRSLVDGFEAPGSYSRNVTYNETSLLQLEV